MADLNFPTSPVNGQTYTLNGVKYAYDSTIGAWLTNTIQGTLGTSLDSQVLYNSSGISTGSNGIIYSTSANTLFVANVVSRANVLANYIFANGAFLTGITTDISSVFNVANAAFNKANTGGVSVGNETASSSTFYPVFTTTTSGIASSQNVSTTKLTFVPSTGTLSATVVNTLSDAREKENVIEIDGMSLISTMHPVEFTWKDNGNKSYGFIAQELEKNFPELVSTDDKGIKSVSYIPVIAMLVDAVNKQQNEIENLKFKINEMEKS
jgi:hypothetical protein